MDAFFASVEVLDNPELAGLPVIVGGSGPRGVVAACTYEARMFGVHSAMPSSVARRLCPQAVFVDGRFHRYIEESRKLHAIFEQVTPLVEGISLDEAFLDVTGSLQLLGDGESIAASIRRRVADELRLSCSVGVGRSKLIAKLASKAAKPRADRHGIREGPGVLVVPVAEELDFLHPLPVRALWGVGPVTGKRLEGLGVATVGDIAALPDGVLERALGTAQGAHLSSLARADDPRPVVPEQEAKSIGHEETFATDLWDRDDLHARLMAMVDASATNLRRSGLAARTISIKIRFADFSLISRAHSLSTPIDATQAVAAVAAALLESVDLDQGVRLLGVSLSGFGHSDQGVQLSLDLDSVGEQRPGSEPAIGSSLPSVASVPPRAPVTAHRAPATAGTSAAPPDGGPQDPRHRQRADDEDVERIQQSWGPITAAVDAIRERYGGSSVGSASLVGPTGLRIRRRGDAQWGPGDDRGSPADGA
jgi:DNA polymerase-4